MEKKRHIFSRKICMPFCLVRPIWVSKQKINSVYKINSLLLAKWLWRKQLFKYDCVITGGGEYNNALICTFTKKTDISNKWNWLCFYLDKEEDWWPKNLAFFLSGIYSSVYLFKVFGKQAAFSKGSLAASDTCPGYAVMLMKRLCLFEGKKKGSAAVMARFLGPCPRH